MGTLFSQQPREHQMVVRGDADDFITWVGELSEKHALPPELILRRLEVFAKLAEVNFKYQNADVLDEQLSGFGKIAQEFVRSVQVTAAAR